jgi:hypothetical protein
MERALCFLEKVSSLSRTYDFKIFLAKMSGNNPPLARYWLRLRGKFTAFNSLLQESDLPGLPTCEISGC